MDDATFLKYKQLFFGWAQKNWSSVDDVTKEEVFFDALTIFLEYQRKGKVSVKPTTFIISVAHRKFELLRKKQFSELKQDLVLEENDLQAQKELVRTGLKQLSEKCQEILMAKYFHNFSMEEIMVETGAKSRSVVRTQKKRCIQKLREIVVALKQAA
ncbi:MAG: sigma-70 family RNA polymerase sigma factor [Bacteroidota bacterium]